MFCDHHSGVTSVVIFTFAFPRKSKGLKILPGIQSIFIANRFCKVAILFEEKGTLGVAFKQLSRCLLVLISVDVGLSTVEHHVKG